MHTTNDSRTFRLTLEAVDAPAFAEAMRRAGYRIADTGDRIMTDAGVDAEHVVLVTVPRDACLTRAERVQELMKA